MTTLAKVHVALVLQDEARCHPAPTLRPLTAETNRVLQVLSRVAVESLAITYSTRVTSEDKRRAPLPYAHH